MTSSWVRYSSQQSVFVCLFVCLIIRCAKSGGGWSNSSKPESHTTAIATTDLCAGACWGTDDNQYGAKWKDQWIGGWSNSSKPLSHIQQPLQPRRPVCRSILSWWNRTPLTFQLIDNFTNECLACCRRSQLMPNDFCDQYRRRSR